MTPHAIVGRPVRLLTEGCSRCRKSALFPEETGAVHGRVYHGSLLNTQKLHAACAVIELKTVSVEER